MCITKNCPDCMQTHTYIHTYIHNLPLLCNGYTVIILSISSMIYKSGKIFNFRMTITGK